MCIHTLAICAKPMYMENIMIMEYDGIWCLYIYIFQIIPSYSIHLGWKKWFHDKNPYWFAKSRSKAEVPIPGFRYDSTNHDASDLAGFQLVIGKPSPSWMVWLRARENPNRTNGWWTRVPLFLESFIYDRQYLNFDMLVVIVEKQVNWAWFHLLCRWSTPKHPDDVTCGELKNL